MEERKGDQIQTEFKLDEFFAMRKGKFTYPAVCITKEMTEDDTDLPIIEGLLAEGTLPLIIIYKDKLLEVKKISKDVKTMSHLLQFYEVQVFINDEVSHLVKTLDELIQLTDFDWS